MVTRDPDPILDVAREEFIIDADFHINTDVADLLPYVEDEMLRRKLELSGHPPVPKIWSPEYSYQGVDRKTDDQLGSDPYAFREVVGQGEAKTEAEVLDVFESIAIDQVIVTPGMNAVPGIHNTLLKNTIARAFNDYLLDNVTNVENDIYGQIMLPHWDAEASAAELDRLGSDESVAGVYGWFGPFTSFGAPEFDPVFDRLVDLDLPLVLHGAGVKVPPFAPTSKSIQSYTELLGLTWPFSAMHNVANMILSGVFDKYPDLDVLLLEAGVNWIPFIAARLDDEYEMHPDDIQLHERVFESDNTHLERMPSEYVFDNFHVGTQPYIRAGNHRQNRAVLEMAHAEETFVFCSDWPHFSFDVPNWVFEDPNIDGQLQENVLRGNAQRIFRI